MSRSEILESLCKVVDVFDFLVLKMGNDVAFEKAGVVGGASEFDGLDGGFNIIGGEADADVAAGLIAFDIKLKAGGRGAA